MLATSKIYQTLVRGEHTKEVRLDIAGTVYNQADIVSLRTYGGLFTKLSIGNAAARELDMKIRPKGNIPWQAKVKLFTRLTNGILTSEWIPAGVFYFSTRDTDRATGVMTVHGYDAMVRADGIWLDESLAAANWPMPVWEAVYNIAGRMGVEIDRRTVLDETFPVSFPVDGDDSGTETGCCLTMREVLQRIAVANGGNWIITVEGKLLLVGLNSAPPETHYLVEQCGAAITIGGVRILV